MRGSHSSLRRRVESVLQMALTTTASLSEQFVSGDIDLRRGRGEEEAIDELPKETKRESQTEEVVQV